jgi:diguanylate cyclase
MYTVWAIAAVAIIVITSSAGGMWLSRRKRHHTSGAGVSTAGMGREEKEAALARIETAVADLMMGVSGSLTTMTGDSTKYGRALEQHRQSLERMATIEDLRELERRLLEQVNEVQSANDKYRRELDAANLRVVEQQKDLEQLRGRVGVDFLTELPNRQRLDEQMREYMNRAERYGQKFSIVVLDVDHFKHINDEHGHTAGDRVLRAIAQLLAENKRASDFLARYGGEEFVLLLPETTLDNASTIAQKICERVRSRNFQFQTQPIRLTLSAGVGEVAPGRDTTESLFERVDKALYDAKDGGRDRVCVSATPA